MFTLVIQWWHSFKTNKQELPWWSSLLRVHLSKIPGPGRFYMARSNWAPAQLPSPMLLESVLHKKRNHCNEKPTYHKEEQPPLTATETHRAKTNQIKMCFKKESKRINGPKQKFCCWRIQWNKAQWRQYQQANFTKQK